MEPITRGWRSVQHLIAQASLGDAFLRPEPGEQFEVIFLGEPIALVVHQTRGKYTAVKAPEMANVPSLHMLHNVFVPELGTVKIVAGDYSFLRRLLAWQYTCGTRNWIYLLAGPELNFELGDHLDAAERSLVETASIYGLDDPTIIELYCTTLQTESMVALAKATPLPGAPS